MYIIFIYLTHHIVNNIYSSYKATSNKITEKNTQETRSCAIFNHLSYLYRHATLCIISSYSYDCFLRILHIFSRQFLVEINHFHGCLINQSIQYEFIFVFTLNFEINVKFKYLDVFMFWICENPNFNQNAKNI